MNRKYIFLIAGIICLVVFIGYLTEPGPHILLGYEINIWIVRLAWFLIAASNFMNYFRMNKAEQEAIRKAQNQNK